MLRTATASTALTRNATAKPIQPTANFKLRLLDGPSSSSVGFELEEGENVGRILSRGVKVTVSDATTSVVLPIVDVTLGAFAEGV